MEYINSRTHPTEEDMQRCTPLCLGGRSNITFIITSDESLCCTPSSLTTIISAS